MKFWIVILLSLAPALAYAQTAGRVQFGAKAAGMGYAVVALDDEWAVFNNIGALAGIGKRSVMLGYDNRYSISGLDNIGCGFINPAFKNGMVGLSVQRFGDNLYNEHRLGLGLSHKISGVSIGGKVNLLQFAIEGLGVRRAFTLEFGGLAQISKVLFMGMHIYNLSQAKMLGQEKLPVVMRAGLSYRPNTKLMLNIDAQKTDDFKPAVHAGLNYQFAGKVSIRTGVVSEPFSGCFGAGINHKNFQFDYTVNTHSVLGFSHHFTLLFTLKKLEKAKEDVNKAH